MKGYKSPLDKILIDSRMDRETLEPMICAIKESLPVFKRFYEKKGELLGHINIFSCRGEEQADRLGEE